MDGMCGSEPQKPWAQARGKKYRVHCFHTLFVGPSTVVTEYSYWSNVVAMTLKCP